MSDNKLQGAGKPDKEIAAKGWSKKVADYRGKLVDLVVLGLPSTIVSLVFNRIAGRFLKQPWQAIWFMVPLAASAWIIWQILKGRGEFKINRRFLLFLSVYVALFSVAAGTNFLDWNRNLTIFGEEPPRSWLMPVRAGDWRYLLVRKTRASRSGLLIVTLAPPQGQSIERVRAEILSLIAVAAKKQASGVALDFFFKKSSRMDPLLCQEIRKADFPVIAGFGFDRHEGELVPTSLPDSLRGCLAKEREGHLGGFLDADHRVRLVPLYYRNRPAFSLVVAHALASLEGRPEEIVPPPDGMLRFIVPRNPIPTLSYEELQEDPDLASELTGQFILVGESSRREKLKTPYGQMLGVRIHADAIHSLLQQHYIRHSRWWLSLLIILAPCYLLTVFAARDFPKWKLARFCFTVSMVLVGVSAIAMISGPVWIDIVYPLVAIWLLLPLLLMFRGLEAKR